MFHCHVSFRGEEPIYKNPLLDMIWFLRIWIGASNHRFPVPPIRLFDPNEIYILYRSFQSFAMFWKNMCWNCESHQSMWFAEERFPQPQFVFQILSCIHQPPCYPVSMASFRKKYPVSMKFLYLHIALIVCLLASLLACVFDCLFVCLSDWLFT